MPQYIQRDNQDCSVLIENPIIAHAGNINARAEPDQALI